VSVPGPTPSEDAVVSDLRAFLLRDVLRGDRGELPLDAPLLSGRLDSLGLVQLMEFLEDRFDLTVANDDVVDENFGSLRALAAFVRDRSDVR
jgi:acyl carrier protein